MRKLYKLGPLLLDPQSRVLTHDGAAVPVGSRGVAVLMALVSKPNEYVEKSAILDAAWPGLVVEEANLAVQISAIRRVLARVPGGENWIETLPRRGYRFVGPVAQTDGRSPSAAALDPKRTNLPEPLTSFVGREREVAEIKQLMPGNRLLTLTGTGGIGKTRLAQQTVFEVLDAYRDGIWFVDLAPLADPALVPNALAQVLQAKESAGQPLVTVLCNHLRTRETLLILDNCEHVLDACACLTEALLRETQHVSLIATSREPLHLAGERVYPLGTLPLPNPKTDAQSIARSDAVQLFLERARQYRPRFDLQEQRARAVAEICVRLDGIPLALELAAARVAALPVEQIVRLLSQRFRLLTGGDRELPRHQTLRAMIDWSYELLDDAEKALFARLSVFAGGWTLTAAEAVCGGEPIGKDDLVYVLIGLIEQSLVVADEDGDRYRMLETVREYAREQVRERGEEAQCQGRHLAYFMELAEEAEPELTGANQPAWLDRLQTEHENLRAALAWSSTAGGDSASGLMLAGAISRFWAVRGYLHEGRRWLSRLLAAAPNAQTAARANALRWVGVLAWRQGDYTTARELYEGSLAIQRGLGDRLGIAGTLNNLGVVTTDQGDYPAARALLEESLGISRMLGNRWSIATSLNNLGVAANCEGEHSSAWALHEEALAIRQDLNDRWGIASSLNNLGIAALNAGDYSPARALFEQSLAIRKELDDRWGISASLNNLGLLADEQGDYASALAFHKGSLANRREIGDRQGIAQSLDGFASVASALAEPRRAASLWGAAERLREEIGAPLSPSVRRHYNPKVAAARAALRDDAGFDCAWQQGRALTLEQAIELASENSFEQA